REIFVRVPCRGIQHLQSSAMESHRGQCGISRKQRCEFRDQCDELLWRDEQFGWRSHLPDLSQFPANRFGALGPNSSAWCEVYLLDQFKPDVNTRPRKRPVFLGHIPIAQKEQWMRALARLKPTRAESSVSHRSM